MGQAEQTNADQLAFWNGVGGQIWVKRQAHTDITLTPIMDALVASAAPAPGEAVLDIGCGCGASTLDIAAAVGSSGSVQALDISETMLEEGERRMTAQGLANVTWQQADAASAELAPYDLAVSAFGTMFFGDPVSAFAHIGAAAKPGARLKMVCWAPLDENPWMGVPMAAVAQHLPPKPPGKPGAPGMFAFSLPEHVETILSASGWTAPRFEKITPDLDIAAGKGLNEAIMQSTQIGAVNSWLRNQPDPIINASIDSIRQALTPYVDGQTVRLPASAWIISSQRA